MHFHAAAGLFAARHACYEGAHVHAAYDFAIRLGHSADYKPGFRLSA